MRSRQSGTRRHHHTTQMVRAVTELGTSLSRVYHEPLLFILPSPPTPPPHPYNRIWILRCIAPVIELYQYENHVEFCGVGTFQAVFRTKSNTPISLSIVYQHIEKAMQPSGKCKGQQLNYLYMENVGKDGHACKCYRSNLISG